MGTWQRRVRGLWGVYWGLVRKRCLGRELWRSAIVSGLFGRVGLFVNEIRRVDIVGLGEKHPG